VAVLGTALLISVVVTAVRVRSHPAPALAAGLVVASVAYAGAASDRRHADPKSGERAADRDRGHEGSWLK